MQKVSKFDNFLEIQAAVFPHELLDLRDVVGPSGSRVDEALAFAAKGVSGTPDGDTDLDFVISMRGHHEAAEHRQSEHESNDLFHETMSSL